MEIHINIKMLNKNFEFKKGIGIDHCYKSKEIRSSALDLRSLIPTFEKYICQYAPWNKPKVG